MPAALGYLMLTVLFETFGTACIQASHQFTRLWPALGVVVGYGISFWFLSQALRSLPLSVVYATWSGLGIINITVVGYLVFDQRLDGLGLAGLALVWTGIVLLHLCSGSARI